MCVALPSLQSLLKELGNMFMGHSILVLRLLIAEVIESLSWKGSNGLVQPSKALFGANWHHMSVAGRTGREGHRYESVE